MPLCLPPSMSSPQKAHLNGVETGPGTTDYFRVETVVLQGDIIPPLSFIVILDYIKTKAMRPPQFPIIWKETKLTNSVNEILLKELK